MQTFIHAFYPILKPLQLCNASEHIRQSAFDALYNTAVALELWEIKLFTLLTYPPAMSATGYAYTLNQRFLGQLLVPERLYICGMRLAGGS
ncbi:hypothetical protein LC612_21165 [Nostoc sp. CHAB 5834]|nr:hypothetical protein [Nostoc sp. CHAB 5834]